MALDLKLNGESISLDVDPEMPLLWAIRDVIGLPGTKYGCGMAQCGACTVHLDGKAIRSCVTPVTVAQGGRITTIEGLESSVAKAVQTASTAPDSSGHEILPSPNTALRFSSLSELRTRRKVSWNQYLGSKWEPATGSASVWHWKQRSSMDSRST